MQRGRLFIEWLLIGLCASLAMLLAGRSPVIERADRLVYDMAAPLYAAPADDRLLVVQIDDDALAALGRWPWPRTLHADALHRLKAAAPAAILYDILFIEPSPQDGALADAVGGSPPVYLPMLFEVPGPDGAPWLIRRPAEPIAGAAAGIGTANLSLDSDGRARSIMLATPDGGQVLPHMAELAYRRLTGHPSPAFARTQADAEAVHVPFLSPGSFRTVSLLQVLRDEVPADFLHNKVLLVGGAAEGLGDIHTVSTAWTGRMPGIEVQANLLSSLLADRFVTPLPPVALFLLSILPLWGLLVAFWRLSPAMGLLLSIGAMLAIVAGSVAALALGGWWFPPVAALFGIILVYPLWGWRRLSAVTRFMENEVKALLAQTGISDPGPGQRWRSDRVASDAGRLHQVIAIMQRNAREREEMLQFLSHDMRSPQAAILALLEGKGDPAADPPLRDRIARLAEQTLRLADDFVQLARLQSRPARRDPVDMADAMAQAADMIWPRAKNRDVRLIREDSEAPGGTRDGWPGLWVMGDAEALVRALCNLLGNAVEASPAGGMVRHGVRQDGGRIVAHVADQGPGLSPERRADPFARFGYSASGGKGGSGLGLAYVATVAERHGGSAAYEDAEGGGAHFSLSLPAAPPDEDGMGGEDSLNRG